MTADPALVLVTKRFVLWDKCEATYDAKDEDAFEARVSHTGDAVAKLDRRIVKTVATTKNGLIAQVRLLTANQDSNHWIDDDDVWVRLGKTIIAGIRALAVTNNKRLTRSEREERMAELVEIIENRRTAGRVAT